MLWEYPVYDGIRNNFMGEWRSFVKFSTLNRTWYCFSLVNPADDIASGDTETVKDDEEGNSVQL